MKFPKQNPIIERKMEYLKRKGCIEVFINRLFPMVRTFIFIPAEMVRMDIVRYAFSSMDGIFIWNLTL